MQFHKSLKIHKICSKDERRPALQAVNFDGHHLTACNGHAAVKITAEDSKDDQPCLISVEAIKAATKGKKGNALLVCTEKETRIVESNVNYPTSDETYPDSISLIVPLRTTE